MSKSKVCSLEEEECGEELAWEELEESLAYSTGSSRSCDESSSIHAPQNMAALMAWMKEDDDFNGKEPKLESLRYCPERLHTMTEALERQFVEGVTVAQRQPCPENDKRSRSHYETRSAMKKDPILAMHDKLHSFRSLKNQQLARTEQDMDGLLKVGQEFLDNVTSLEKANVIRDMAQLNDLRKRIEGASIATAQQVSSEFEEMRSRWTELSEGAKSPSVETLFETLEGSKVAFKELMERKEQLVMKCEEKRLELYKLFDLEAQQQYSSTCVLIERITSHLKNFQMAYAVQFELLGKSLEQEYNDFHRALRENCNRDLEKLKTHCKTLHQIKDRNTKMCEDFLEQLFKEEIDSTFTAAKTLRTLSLQLQDELAKAQENVRFHYDKLAVTGYGYFYRVPEEEMILNIMKHGITKTQNNIRKLREGKVQIINENRLKINAMEESLNKLHERITDTEEEIYANFKIESRKILKIWEMHFNEATECINEILAMYKMILPYESISEYDPVQMKDFLPEALRVHLKPSPLEQPSFINLTTIVKPPKAPKKPKRISFYDQIYQKKICGLNWTRFLRNVLRFCPTHANLANENVLRLIAKDNKAARDILQVNAVLDMLNIGNVQDLKCLGTYFLPAGTELEAKVSTQDECPQIVPNVNPLAFLTALTKYATDRKEQLKKLHEREEQIELPTSQEVRDFWKRFMDLVPQEFWKLWDLLPHALKHHYDLLQRRKRLLTRTEFLRKQNAELRRLLKEYL